MRHRVADKSTEDVTREYWQRIAAGFSDFDPSLVDLAIKRLVHGDVTDTQHGVRVALRADLGDSRLSAGAYWPEGGCRCYSQKSRGRCSHELAMLMLHESEGVLFPDLPKGTEF